MLFPELALTGYPPEDLLLKEHFLDDAARGAAAARRRDAGDRRARRLPRARRGLYNALAVLADGEVHAVYRKVHLPNYGVFDEQRYFQAGDGRRVIELGDVRVGLTICEDIWLPGPPADRGGAARARR